MKKILNWLAGIQHHKVTFFAIGVMGNKYEVGTFEATSNREQRKSQGGNIPNVVFAQHYKTLLRHYRPSSNGDIRYSSITHKAK